MKRHNKMMKHHDKTTKRQNDNEPMWSVISRTCKSMSGRGQPTNRTYKMTRRTHKAMSQLLKMASQAGNWLSWTQKTMSQLEESVCGNGETSWNDKSNILSTIYHHKKHIRATIPQIVTCNSHAMWVRSFSWMGSGKFAPSLKCQSSDGPWMMIDVNFKLEIYCPWPQYDLTQNRMQGTDKQKGTFVTI